MLRERQQLIRHLLDKLSHRKTFQPALRNPLHSIHRACQLSIDKIAQVVSASLPRFAANSAPRSNELER